MRVIPDLSPSQLFSRASAVGIVPTLRKRQTIQNALNTRNGPVTIPASIYSSRLVNNNDRPNINFEERTATSAGTNRPSDEVCSSNQRAKCQLDGRRSIPRGREDTFRGRHTPRQNRR